MGKKDVIIVLPPISHINHSSEKHEAACCPSTFVVRDKPFA